VLRSKAKPRANTNSGFTKVVVYRLAKVFFLAVVLVRLSLSFTLVLVLAQPPVGKLSGFQI
jgi:hypothetical protein